MKSVITVMWIVTSYKTSLVMESYCLMFAYCNNSSGKYGKCSGILEVGNLGSCNWCCHQTSIQQSTSKMEWNRRCSWIIDVQHFWSKTPAPCWIWHKKISQFWREKVDKLCMYNLLITPKFISLVFLVNSFQNVRRAYQNLHLTDVKQTMP